MLPYNWNKPSHSHTSLTTKTPDKKNTTDLITFHDSFPQYTYVFTCLHYLFLVFGQNKFDPPTPWYCFLLIDQLIWHLWTKRPHPGEKMISLHYEKEFRAYV